MLKIQTLIVSVCALLISIPVAFAVGVKPIRTEITVDRGSTATAVLRVINSEATAITVRPEIVVYTKNNLEGFPIAEELAADDPRNIASWIEFDRELITLEPNSEEELSFTAAVPSTVLPGGYYGAVLLTAVNHETASFTQPQIAVPSLILLKVTGLELHLGEIENFSVRPEIYSDQGVIFETLFSNTGNLHEKPSGEITLQTADGAPLTGIARYQDPATREIVVADALPFNLAGGNVLPGSSRLFETSWRENVQSGEFIATLKLNFGNSDQATKVSNFELGTEKLSLDKFELSKLKESTDFTIDLENEGSVYERLSGTIDIQDTEFEGTLASLKIPADMDYVVPGGIATLTIPWLDKPIPQGKYTATLTATYGLADIPLTAKIEFVSRGNLLLWLALGGAGVILFVGITVLLRRRKKDRSGG